MAVYKRYIGNTGKFYRIDDKELPDRDRRMTEAVPQAAPPPPLRQPTPPPTRQPASPPFSLFPGGEGLGSLRHLLGGLLPESLDLGDLLLILIDASDPEAMAQLSVTEELLESLGAADKPTLYVFNKCDLGAANPGMARARDNVLYISAATGQGLDLLLSRIEQMLHADKRRVTFRIPNAKQGLLARLYENATVESVDYGAEAVSVVAVVDAKTYGPLRAFDVAPPTVEDDDE